MRYFYAWLVAVADIGLMVSLGAIFIRKFFDESYGYALWLVFCVAVLVPLFVAGFAIIAHLLG